MTDTNKGKALLLAALCKFRQNVPPAKKSGYNPFTKSNYSTLEDVTEAIGAGIKDTGLDYHHVIDNLVLTTYLTFSDGENWAEIPSSLSVNFDGKNQMQAIGGAITYAKRYTLQSLFGIPSEDDDAASLQGAAIKKAPPPAPAKQPFATESLEKAKPKIEAKFKNGVASDPVEIAQAFKSNVINSGFEMSPDVERQLADFCIEMAAKHNDSVE